MENEGLKNFYQAVAMDEALRGRLSALGEMHGKSGSDKEAFKVDLIDFAKAEGFDFTADDLNAFLESQTSELSDIELENVLDGGCKNTKTCLCVIGGGGTQNGVTCPCPIYGVSDFNNGYGLGCEFYGQIMTSERLLEFMHNRSDPSLQYR